MRAQRRFSLLWSLIGLSLIMLSTGCKGCMSWPDCEDDEQCVNYQRGTPYCVDGICVACRGDGDCERGQECRNGSCVAIPGWCEDDSQCGDGQICENNRCRAGCRADADCGAGMMCENNRCVEARECNLDRDCGAGECCQSYECVPCSPCSDRAFETVLFDFDESVIRVDQESRLQANAECLNEFPQDEVRIEGHCDERGTDAYNLALGERRARASRTFLERLGISRDRMDIISYGESRPAASCHNESCWRQNRRSEFTWR